MWTGFKVARMAAFSIAAAVLTACGGGGDGVAAPAPPGGSMGTLRVALTDAPACGFDHVYVTVDRVRVHMSPSAADSDGGWSEIVLKPAQRIDLLGLTNGVLAELGQTPLPAGLYTQVRLLLRSNGGGGTPANALVLTGSGGVETPLDTPSATQSGLKLAHSFTVPPNELVDLVLDFDACRSVVRRGNSGQHNLKPVIKVIPRNTTVIVGAVDPTLTGVTVSAQKLGVVERSTAPNAGGEFVLSGLDPAKTPYDVVLTAANRATAVISGVPVALNTTTPVSTTTAPIMLAGSAMGGASGTALPVSASPAVRAVQAVGAVPKVEIAHANGDAVTGNWSLNLPIEAARLATYSSMLPLTFLPQGGTAAAYTLEAFATGYVTQTKPITVSATPSTDNNFTLVPTP